MLTFSDQVLMAQEISGAFSAEATAMFKRDINEGGVVFLNRLGIKFNREYLTGNLTANQQYYQLPAKVIRVSELKVLQGTTWNFPTLVVSEDEWNKLNASVSTASVPTHYYIRGNREVGLYPIPDTNTTNSLSISYEPQHGLLTHDDFKTGTVQVTIDQTAVTLTGAVFQPQMVGRYLQVTDGTDGRFYRIASFTSTTQVELENFYEGISGAGRSYRIGEVMKIPDGYQDAPVYYALDRYYLTQSSPKDAQIYQLRFKDKLKEARETYGASTSRSITGKLKPRNSSSPFTDLSRSIG